MLIDCALRSVAINCYLNARLADDLLLARPASLSLQAFAMRLIKALVTTAMWLELLAAVAAATRFPGRENVARLKLCDPYHFPCHFAYLLFWTSCLLVSTETVQAYRQGCQPLNPETWNEYFSSSLDCNNTDLV